MLIISTTRAQYLFLFCAVQLFVAFALTYYHKIKLLFRLVLTTGTVLVGFVKNKSSCRSLFEEMFVQESLQKLLVWGKLVGLDTGINL